MSILSNDPSLWNKNLILPSKESNKYSRGWSIILGGSNGTTGAAKLASIAALRSGSGLATIYHSAATALVYQVWSTSIITKLVESVSDFTSMNDSRITAFLLGPGAGVNTRTKKIVLAILKLQKPCVIDADAITVFADNPKELFSALHDKVILTPHFGEFSRIFPTDFARIKMVQVAAKETGCTVLLKGHDTIIAHNTGKVVINHNASPYLATAGSGDVLAGIITGLIATGMDSFAAACAGVYIHSKSAEMCGIGMISDDLLDKISLVLTELKPE